VTNTEFNFWVVSEDALGRIHIGRFCDLWWAQRMLQALLNLDSPVILAERRRNLGAA